MNFLNDLIYFKTLRQLNDLLTYSFKKRSVLIFILILISVVLELLGMSFIAPIIMMAFDFQLLMEISIIKSIYEIFNFTSTRLFIITIISGFFLLFLIKSILSIIISKKFIDYGYQAGIDISTKQFRNFTHQNYLDIKNEKSTLVERNIITIPNFLVNFILLPIISISSEILVLIFIFIGLLFYDWKVVLLLFCSVFPPFIFTYKFSKGKLEFFSKKILELSPKLNQWVFQSFFGFVDMKTSNRESYFLKKFRKNIIEKSYYQSWQNLFKSIPIKIIELSILLLIVLITLYGFWFISDKESFSIFLTIFSVSLFRIMPSVNRIIQSFLLVKSYNYIFDFFHDFSNEIEEIPQKKIIVFNKIVFKDLNFSYDNSTLLKDVNFEINKTDFVGLTGSSGSGKSTLINIILQFLKPQKGEILINNKSIINYNISDWRNLIGYVQQDVYIIDGDVNQNIAFAEEVIDHKKIAHIVKKVNLENFIENLPNKFDSRLGENGALVSGGQKQRIGIARALYNDCKILILDEATNSLDKNTEFQILKILKILNEQGLTIILISHSDSALKYCNKIYNIKSNQLILNTISSS